MQTPSQTTFYGYEQRTNISRLFKIYATPRGLHFGWIADRDYEEMMARFGGAGIGQNTDITQQSAQGAARWEDHYETLDIESEKFLEAHEENFAFVADDAAAASLTWKLKFTEKAATRFGALDLVCNGKKRRFYLVGQRSSAQVAQAVRYALPAAAIEPLTNEIAAPITISSGAQVPDEMVYKSPSWPILITAYVAAIGLSLWLAATYNFWLPLGACAVAIPAYRFIRFSTLLLNYKKDAAEQLRRNRTHGK